MPGGIADQAEQGAPAMERLRHLGAAADAGAVRARWLVSCV
jgi:hypothetical protein